MMGKTHIAVGVASAYLVIQPQTPEELAIATIGGCLGATLADVDIRLDARGRSSRRGPLEALYCVAVAVVVALVVLVADWLAGGRLLVDMVRRGVPAATGLVALAVLVVWGRLGEHRGRTHSVLALAAFTGAVSLVHAGVGAAFGVSYASHLAIDLLNRRGLRLLYPLRRTLCLGLCSADGLVNRFLLVAGTCAVGAYVLKNPLLQCAAIG